MTIEERRDGTKALLIVEGRLNTVTAPDLERELDSLLTAFVTEITLDFSKLTMISSTGLRVMLQAQKKLSAKKGRLVITNISPLVREVFEMTGLIGLFVQDERLVIVQKDKTETMASFAISGHIEEETVQKLDENLLHMLIVEEPKLTALTLDLAGIISVSPEGRQRFQDMQKRIEAKNIPVTLENVPEQIKL